MSLEKIEQLTDMNNLNLSIFLPRSIDEEVNRFIIIIIIIFMLVTCGGSFLQRWTLECVTDHVCVRALHLQLLQSVGHWRAFCTDFLGKSFSCPFLGPGGSCSPCLNLNWKLGRGRSAGLLVSLWLSWVPGRRCYSWEVGVALELQS